jgi:hypothetical protein
MAHLWRTRLSARDQHESPLAAVRNPSCGHEFPRRTVLQYLVQRRCIAPIHPNFWYHRKSSFLCLDQSDTGTTELIGRVDDVRKRRETRVTRRVTLYGFVRHNLKFLHSPPASSPDPPSVNPAFQDKIHLLNRSSKYTDYPA